MAARHARNTHGMHSAPRCGAKTRKGSACEAPAIRGKKRCRMHGGKGSGAPVKHGLYTRESLQSQKAAYDFIRFSRNVLRSL
jgi:hypothetical protein